MIKLRDTLYIPAMTSVFPINATKIKQIKFLKRQIAELEAQKKCYDKMIRDRKKAIKKIKNDNSKMS